MKDLHVRIWTAPALAVGLSLAAPTLTAQTGTGGQVELGGFGIYTGYDQTNVGFTSKLGAGGWAGFYLNRTFKVEGFGDFTETRFDATGSDMRVARVGGALLAHTALSAFTPYVGVGYERLIYRGAMDVDDNAGVAIIGSRFSLGGRAAVRFEGRLNYIPNTNLTTGSESAFNVSGAFGISIFAFGGPIRDDDSDAVANKNDDCPGTPMGAMVDGQGCPTDGDSDMVFDGLDQCPDTPIGASVNDSGCPNDSDSDAVLDGIDVCPNTPAGAVVDVTGCPSDSDADGVLNGIDVCPDTPAGAVVDAQGCPIDTDADGVYDGLDQCTGTPAGEVVNEQGCPLDTDGDGIPDGSDACPGTPAGAAVDIRGCQVDLDGDADGVPDRLDECPNTAPGTVVDSRGCALASDSDGDGIPDSRDRCPGTQPGENVDAVGCPQLFEVEGVARTSIVLYGVTFETGRSSLTQASSATLDRVAQSLIANPDVRIEIAGHTDNTGSMAVNRRLSLQRAQSVKAYLARQGVRPDRMETRGYGPDQPIASNDTVEGRRQNRRVELKLLEQGEGN